MLTQLIINADDFGYSPAINYGIIEAFKKGVVTSTTLMVNMPGAAHAAALALDNKELGVGIHLVLTCGKPISQLVPTLIKSDGSFTTFDQIIENGSVSEIEEEFKKQMETFVSYGLRPTHIDSHHHVHAHNLIFPIVEKLAIRWGLPIRKITKNKGFANQLDMVDYFDHTFYGDNLNNQVLIDSINKITSFETAEIMCHPGFLDEAVCLGSSYNIQRIKEWSILTSPEIKMAIEQKKIVLSTYNIFNRRK